MRGCARAPQLSRALDGYDGEPMFLQRDEFAATRSKFWRIVELLATGYGDVRARLKDASLVLWRIDREELPKDLRADLDWINGMLSRRPARHDWEGTLDPSVDSMRRATASKVAEKLVGIYMRLALDAEGHVDPVAFEASARTKLSGSRMACSARPRPRRTRRPRS